MIGSLANYSNTIPSAPDGADGDAKPPPPSARMGKQITLHSWSVVAIWLLNRASCTSHWFYHLHVLLPLFSTRHTYWMFFAMYSEHFRCDIVHSSDVGRWNCWRHLRFCYRFNMLLCGEYDDCFRSKSRLRFDIDKDLRCRRFIHSYSRL